VYLLTEQGKHGVKTKKQMTKVCHML